MAFDLYGARGGTRTRTGFPIRTSSVRVCHFTTRAFQQTKRGESPTARKAYYNGLYWPIKSGSLVEFGHERERKTTDKSFGLPPGPRDIHLWHRYPILFSFAPTFKRHPIGSFPSLATLGRKNHSASLARAGGLGTPWVGRGLSTIVPEKDGTGSGWVVGDGPGPERFLPLRIWPGDKRDPLLAIDGLVLSALPIGRIAGMEGFRFQE
jgi:hypothetical protein